MISNPVKTRRTNASSEEQLPRCFPCSLHPGQQKKQQPCSPGGAGGKEPAHQGRRHTFHPWVGKIPWRRAWLPTPIVFLPGESRGQRSLAATVQGVTESDPTERCLPADTRAQPGHGLSPPADPRALGAPAPMATNPAPTPQPPS